MRRTSLTLRARRVLLVLAALSLPCGAGLAAEIHCDVESDYELSLNERSLILTRESAGHAVAESKDSPPKAVVMRQGRLFVDDEWVTLSVTDSQRIAAFEQGTRAVMPEAQAIGRAAADIAFTALGEVAAGFSPDPKAVRAKLARARAQLDARLARSVTANRFNGSELGDGIGEAVAEVIPSMIGDIIGGAISAAFSGDASRLKRMENLDAQIEAQVRPRADALEQRAEGLCLRMVELDRIDNALEYRTRHGQPLNLMQADAGRTLPAARKPQAEATPSPR
ncbi:DUF2884 family protein [Lysobacter koreensis]|uniref:DUF2884 family protein n=1 Tax=Lysobacter koreensis TaxID=266122 RepID=A0ABW2YPK2_9GAMM